MLTKQMEAIQLDENVTLQMNPANENMSKYLFRVEIDWGDQDAEGG